MAILSLVLFVGEGEAEGEELHPVRQGKGQRLFVVSSVVPADIQQGVDFPLDLQSEAVDETQLVRIVAVIEGQTSALIVQEQSQPAGGHRQRKDHPWWSEGFINSVLQSDQPHSALWGLHQLGLPTGCSFDQTKTPLGFDPHLHLYGGHNQWTITTDMVSWQRRITLNDK